MDQIKKAIRQMVSASEEELDTFLETCFAKTFRRKEVVLRPHIIPNEIFFINKGLFRVIVTDPAGTDHTVHFALENQFISDYANFLLKQPSIYTIEAVEETEAVVIPRKAIEWGYGHMAEGEKLGRLVAEFYFIYHDDRIRNQYARSPKERYDAISQVFPNIHNRVPQHMIASYLGITPVHLSRLKKSDY